MIKVILAEDQNIVRYGIRSLLDQDKTFKIVGEALNGKELLSMVDDGIEADIILTDINMPGVAGVDLIKRIKQAGKKAKIVILTLLDDEKYVVDAFKAGVTGYILKNVSADELSFAIKHIHADGRYICSELAMRFFDKVSEQPDQSSSYPNVELTKREAEVLQMIAEGMTNQEIADTLFTSKRTVEGHRQNLLMKTGSRNTAALIKFAIFKKMIS